MHFLVALSIYSVGMKNATVFRQTNTNEVIKMSVEDVLKIVKEKEVKFVVTDFKNEINVVYSGVVPNLFAEEKGVVAEGFLKDKNFFLATKILAKHDENYMPPEVKESLKKNVK